MREQRVQAVDTARRLPLQLGAGVPRIGPRAARRTRSRSASLDGTVGSGSSTSRLGSSASSSARLLGHLRHAARQRPHVHAHRLRHEPGGGRADARPPAPDRRRQRSDAAELDANPARRGSGGGASVAAPAPVRSLSTSQITFDALPSVSRDPGGDGRRRRLHRAAIHAAAPRSDPLHSRSGPMTGRDRMVVMVLAPLGVLAAVWLLAVAPEREQAAKLATEVSTAQAQLASAESQLASAQRRAEPSTERLRLDRAASAKPSRRSGSALADLPALAGRRMRRTSNSPRSRPSVSGVRARASTAAPRERSATAAAAASRRCRSRSCSTAASTASTASFSSSTASPPHTTSGELHVSGRLLTIQSIKLAPGTSSGSASRARASNEQLSGTITATAYVLPAGQSLTGGATPAGPAGTADADGLQQLEHRAPPTPRP